MFSFFSRKPAANGVPNQLRTPSPTTTSTSVPRPQHSPGSPLGIQEPGPPITPSPPPEPDIDNRALHTLVSSIPAKTAYDYLLKHLKPAAVSRMDKEMLVQLTLFFKDLTPPQKLHCARCHADYFAVENTDRSCRINHDDESAEVMRGGGINKDSTYETLWGCCGKTVEGDGDMGPPDGWCYEGLHTTDPRRARFRADSEPFPGDDKLASCKKMKCNRDGMETERKRPARKRARMVSYVDESDHELGEDGGGRAEDDEDEEDEERSVKSSSTKGKAAGRKRRKLSPEPLDDTGNAMDVDSTSVGSSSKPRAPAKKPRSPSGSSKPRSKAKPSVPPVPPLPDTVSAPALLATRTTVKSSMKAKSVKTPTSIVVVESQEDGILPAASGEEAEAEDTEPPPPKRKKSTKKAVPDEEDAIVDEDAGTAAKDKEKKRKKKKRTGDDAAYVDTAMDQDHHSDEDQDGEGEKKKRKKKRKSAAAATGEEEVIEVDDAGDVVEVVKKVKAKKKAKPVTVEEEEEPKTDDGEMEMPAPLSKPGAAKKRKKLGEVVESSVPGEKGFSSPRKA